MPYIDEKTKTRLNRARKWPSASMDSSYSIGVGTLTIGYIKSRSVEEDDAVITRFVFSPRILDWAMAATFRKQDGIFNITLQPMRLVKINAPIFRACALGDTEAVTNLIGT